jgi:phosphatidylglycerophosphatase A
MSEYILACIIIVCLYGFAIYWIYDMWKENYKFDVTKISFKPKDEEPET